MEKDFLVFWAAVSAHGMGVTMTTVMRVKYPPHEPPRGSMLRGILAEEITLQIERPSVVVRVQGAVELPAATWNNNLVLEMACFDGRVASVECTGGAWRIVA